MSHLPAFSRLFFPAVAAYAMLNSCVMAESHESIMVGTNPESVCRGFGGKLYVTMINGEVPGDGTIALVEGENVTVFAKGFNAPKGLVFVGDYLVTADETTMWKVDKSGSATKLAEAKDFPNPIEFLNDVVAGHDGASVYVSEMSSPKPMFDPAGDRALWGLESPQAKTLPNKGCIYKVTLKGEVSVAVPAGNPAIRFPNGVTLGTEGEGIFVGDFFSGEIVNYLDGKYTTLATGMRGIDGLTVTKDAFYASSWTQGKVWKVDRKTRQATVILEGLKSAADYYFDAKNHQLIIPDMLSGTLTFLPIK